MAQLHGDFCTTVWQVLESTGFPPGLLEFELTEHYVGYFRSPGEDAPYFVVWTASGEVFDRSEPAREVPRPETAGTP